MALTQIKSGAIADDAIDSSTYIDGSIDNAHLADDAVDSDQYVDGSIDNAHLADDAVGVAELSATGTASSSTFLRGDNAWAAAGGGKILQVVEVKHTGTSSFTSTTYADYSALNTSIIAATGSKIIVLIVIKFMCLGEASIGYGNQANFGLKVMRSDDGFSSDTNDLYTSRSDSGGKYAAFLAGHDGSTTIVLGGDVSNQFYDESPGGDGSKSITYKVQAAKGHGDMGTLYLGEFDGSSMILIEVGA